jgi:peptide/nickel transport system ATP-binding protein
VSTPSHPPDGLPADTSVAAATAPAETLLEVRDLHIEFATDRGAVRAVDSVSFTVPSKTTLGIVGESGSGKSATALALVGLHRSRNATVTGEVLLGGQQLIGAPSQVLRAVRGDRIGMIFQEPLSALHPQYTVGDQIIEAYRAHRDVPRRAARRKAIEMLDLVRIPRADRRADDYPHQFSGGMRQRIMIAMALCCDPDLLVADEPTTALDVTTQAEVLALLRDLQQQIGMAIILITHDFGVIGEMADNVMVMYAGRAVETAPAESVFTSPGHPYTWGLLNSMVSLDQPRPERLAAIPGQPPSLIHLPPGCAFHPRCPHAAGLGDRCAEELPELSTVTTQHAVACHLPADDRERIRRAAAQGISPAADDGKTDEDGVASTADPSATDGEGA